MNEYWIFEEGAPFPNISTTARSSRLRTKTLVSRLKDEPPVSLQKGQGKEAWESRTERWHQSCYLRRTKVRSQQFKASTLLFSKTLTNLSGAIKSSWWPYFPRLTTSVYEPPSHFQMRHISHKWAALVSPALRVTCRKEVCSRGLASAGPSQCLEYTLQPLHMAVSQPLSSRVPSLRSSPSPFRKSDPHLPSIIP